jgi:hypothetical protein
VVPDIFQQAAQPRHCFIAGIHLSHSTPGGIEFHVGRDTFGDSVTGQRPTTAKVAKASDSGWIGVELIGEAGGPSIAFQWAVVAGIPSPLNYAGFPCGPIRRVQVHARVTGANLRISWRNIVVMFHEDGAAESRITLDDVSNPVADTMGLTDPAAATGAFEILLAQAGSRRLIVSGQVRLESAVSPILRRLQLAGQVRVWAEPAPAAARAAARRSLLDRLT